MDTFAAATSLLAAATDRQPSTAPLPEQVDLCADLGALARGILDHTQHVLMGDDADWADLAERLTAAADRCRRQVVVELTDIGDSGSR